MVMIFEIFDSSRNVLDRIGIFPLNFLAFHSYLPNLSLRWSCRNHIGFSKSILIYYLILQLKPYWTMKRLSKQIQCVISNREFISSESAHSPSTARRYAKGIVLSQQIGFNEGSYASLRDLKNFYRKLNDDKAPSHSLIVRRALDLLSHQVSSYRTHKDINKEKEIFSILTDLKRKNKGGQNDYR